MNLRQVSACCSFQIKTETVPLLGRSGILNEHQNNFFCGVCCGIGDRSDTVFAITESGLLCEFNSKRCLSKWVLLRVSPAIAVILLADQAFILLLQLCCIREAGVVKNRFGETFTVLICDSRIS